ncbi:MAG: GSCFA domain protein, partial [Bacteroidaceae bacterium]|nr:GSCFA domain protein [Bacteroidaceae bacterium]
TAAGYVWECFRNTYFGEATDSLATQIEDITRALAHRPFDAQAQAHIEFKRKLLSKIEALKEKYPLLDFSNETEQCRTQ